MAPSEADTLGRNDPSMGSPDHSSWWQRLTAWSRLPDLLVANMVFAWVGIMLPVVLDLRLRQQAPAAWWLGAFGQVVLLLVMRDSVRHPRAGRHHLVTLAMFFSGALAVAVWDGNGMSPNFFVMSGVSIGFVLSPRVVRPLVLFAWAVLGYAAWHGTYSWGWVIVFAAEVSFGAFAVEIAVREISARQKLDHTVRDLEATNAQLTESNAELEAAHRRLALTQAQLAEQSRAAERLRIARDLHDTVGHQLTALTLSLEVAAHLAEGPATTHVNQARTIARDVLADIRGVVSQLRDPVVGLSEGLTRLAAAFPSLDVTVTVAPDCHDAAPAATEAVLRVAQEALTNAARHSGADHVWVKLACSGLELTLEVGDNGRGVDRVQPGNGLRGINERIHELGGDVIVESAPGTGFRILVQLPRDPEPLPGFMLDRRAEGEGASGRSF